MKNLNKMAGLAAIASLAVACSSTPEQIAELEEARAAVNAVQSNPKADEFARQDLERAKSALEVAEKARDDGDDIAVITHEAVTAQRYAEIAEAKIAEQTALEEIERAELERSRIQADARAREAERAQMLAEQRAQEAAEARLQADVAMAEAEELQAQLSDLKAEQTERGLVLTLGDVLFDTNSATLKPGASQTIDRLAEFLNEHQDRSLLVEGHTDSRGSDEYNQQLSQRRADSVRMALIDAGVSSGRLNAKGLGEAYPVASNDTSAGRQENRRVDIIIQSADEQAARR